MWRHDHHVDVAEQKYLINFFCEEIVNENNFFVILIPSIELKTTIWYVKRNMSWFTKLSLPDLSPLFFITRNSRILAD